MLNINILVCAKAEIYHPMLKNNKPLIHLTESLKHNDIDTFGL